MCFPFPFVFSVHNLSQRRVGGTVAKQKKRVCLFTFLFGIFSYLFVFAFFVFSNFFVLFSCVFEHFSFWVLVLECFSSVASFFYVSLFVKTLFGLIIVFLTFFSLLLHTLLAHKNVKWIFPKRLDRLRGRYQSQCASSGHGWHGDEAKRSKQTWQNVKAKQRWISN